MAAISIFAVDAAPNIRKHARGAVAAVALWASLVLGGATKAGFLADTVLQLLAVGLIVVLLLTPPQGRTADHKRQMAVAFAILLVFVLSICIQLVPLPPELWMKLPGRSRWAELPGLAGEHWRPLSLAPEMTRLALVSLIPPIVIFWATATSGLASRRVLVASVVIFASFSAMLGLAQVAQGPESALRPFEVTNRTEAVGMFANRNHFAALLYSAIVLMFPWAAVASTDLVEAMGSRRGISTGVILAAIAAFTLIVVLMSGQAISRSRAGIALTALAVIGGALLTMAIHRGGKLHAARVPLAAVLLALVFALQFTLYRNLERFDFDPFADARVPYAQNTLTAALELFPFGAGVGSFVEVYGSFERLRDVHQTFANRAHNDFLEGWLELGLPGIIVLGLFVVWYLSRCVSIWRAQEAWGEPLDRMIVRAAALVVLLLVAHSFVDYPLRTGAMSALFAMCCGLLIPVPHPPRQESLAAERQQHELRARSAHRREPPSLKAAPVVQVREPALTPPPLPRTSPEPVSAKPPKLSVAPDRRWGDDMQWPEQWKSGTGDGQGAAGTTSKKSWEEAVEKLAERKPPKGEG